MITIEKGKPVHKRSDKIYYGIILTLSVVIILLILSLYTNAALTEVTQSVNTAGRIRGSIQGTFLEGVLKEDISDRVIYINGQFDTLLDCCEQYPLIFPDVILQDISDLREEWNDLIGVLNRKSFTNKGLHLLQEHIWEEADALTTAISDRATRFRTIQSYIVVIWILILLATLYQLTLLKRVFITGLIRSTLTDHLTGINSRTYMREYIAEYCQRTGTDKGKSFHAFILADIDHFKEVNDTYGHQRGDEVLISVANVLRKHSGKQSLLFRYGGEEFLLVSRVSQEKDAAAYTEEIRRDIAASLHAGLHLTMSFGIGICDDSPDFNTVISLADTALYAAKDAGRNCTYISMNGDAPHPALQ